VLEQTIHAEYKSVYDCFSEVSYRRITQLVLVLVLTWTAAAAQRTDANVDAQTRQGMVAAEANKLKEAERHFAAAASLAPADPSTRNNYGAI